MMNNNNEQGGNTCPEPQNAAVFGEQVRQLYSLSGSQRVLPAVGQCVAFLALQPYPPLWSLFVVLALQIGGTAVFTIAENRYAAEAESGPIIGKRAEVWGRRFTLLCLVTGLSWGAMGLFWFNPASTSHQALLAMVLLGIMTSATITRSIHLPSLYTFILAVSVPGLSRAAWEAAATQNIETGTIGFFGTLLTYAIWGWARRLNDDHVRAVRLRIENANLVDRLTEAREEALRERELALKAKDAAEAGARAKTEFLATISHEIRTPLNGILGMTRLLGDEELTDQQSEYARTIVDCGEQLNALIDHILDLSELEGGQLVLSPEDLDPEELCFGIASVFGHGTRQVGLEFCYEPADDLPATVHADPRRIRQVLTNLLANAVKFTDNGRITLKIERDEVDGFVRFSVADTGIGIPEKDFPRLFETFTQIDQSFTRRHGGAGVGLAVCRRLVEMMNGRIGVYTSVGTGSEFWFTVPIAAGTQKPENSGTAIVGPFPEEQRNRATKPTGERTAPQDEQSLHPSDPQPEYETLGALELQFGKETLIEILAAYLETAAETGRLLAANAAELDPEQVREAAHTLKGAAGNLGFKAICESANLVLEAARSGDLGAAAAGAEQLVAELEKNQQILKSSYPALAA